MHHKFIYISQKEWVFLKKKKKDTKKIKIKNSNFPTNAEKIQPTHHISFFFFFFEKNKTKNSYISI